MVDFVFAALVTLMVVVDPIGLAPAFVSVTHEIPPRTRRAVALRAAGIAALILTGTALGGNWVLRELGISLHAFRISGGILLFAVAFEMVLGVRPQREARQAEQAIEEHARNVAVFPLAIPLIAGPGAMTATLLLAGRSSDMTMLAMLVGVIIVVTACCVATFLAAERISHAFGATGNAVLSRVLGVVLAALAVQFVIDGARSAFS